MEYSFECPFAGDSTILYVEADDEAEAKTKLLATAKQHVAQEHEELVVTDDELEEMIEARMWEGAPDGHPGEGVEAGGIDMVVGDVDEEE